jgi:RNA polymerase sigma-70 factor (ECF subfamily)
VVVTDLEESIRNRIAAGDLRAAATAAIEGYGPEVFGFLMTVLRDHDDAADVFSQACEDLWAGLPRFEGRSSFKTWFYTVARNAAWRFRQSPHRRVGRRVALSEIADIAERVRTRTLPFLNTGAKTHLAAIRGALREEDRALLVLRVDRDLSWKEIARIMCSEAESDEALARAAAKLRKRFQFVKEEIRARAREAGLLTEEDA